MISRIGLEGRPLQRGSSTRKKERVKEIKCTSEGSLVARVEGTIEYFTEVSLENGKLSSICTCPVGHDCKHGVAAVLEYLERIEQGEEVPVIAEEDLLIARARRGYAGAGTSGAYEAEESSRALREYLEQLEKPELIEILITFAKKDSYAWQVPERPAEPCIRKSGRSYWRHLFRTG